MKLLIISDGKPGHVNQARALCSMLGAESTEIVVSYPLRAGKAAGYILDRVGCYTSAPFGLTWVDGDKALHPDKISGNFAGIVAVSSAAYYPAKVVGKQHGWPVAALMYPRGFRNNFAHILCPGYDNPPAADNITTLPITLCRRSQAYYEEMVADFGRQFEYALPGVGVIIGGDNKYEQVTAEVTKKNLEQIFALTPDHQHWVTTSRRTSDEVEAVVESFPFDYKLIYSKKQYNPIPAFLQISDYLFATSDSASMVSECVSTGTAKVEILKNVSKRPSKFDRFISDLQELGAVHVFDGTLGTADKKLDLAPTIVEALGGVFGNATAGTTNAHE
ncbi:MAG: ELM1/GtrOC1 family putative glycosyltransferase [Planctomycetota bacterium]|jgi:mitochondrial fission protein ELM1